MALTFLIALTDPEAAQRFARALEERGHRALPTPDAETAGQALGQEPVDGCFLGTDLPERLSLARALADRGKVVVLVGEDPVDALEPELLESLASDLVRPSSLEGGLQEALEVVLQRVLRLRQVLSEREELRTHRIAPLGDLLEGSAPATRRLRADVERVAGTPRTTVRIQGEPGTRKDVLARGIHGLSVRRRAPVRTLDGREARRSGFNGHLAELLATTAGGTLVLEEVAALELPHQRELARILAEPPVDVRFVATTSADLEALAARGRFSDDLLYRLNVLTLEVPPLRERREDLAELARSILTRGAAAGFIRPDLSPAAQAQLLEHDWPGNLRELEACLVRAAHAAGSDTIHPGHLGLPGAHTNGHASPSSLDLGDRSLRGMEEALIRRVLEDEQGNRSRSARVLGINRSTLYNKLRLYGIG